MLPAGPFNMVHPALPVRWRWRGDVTLQDLCSQPAKGQIFPHEQEPFSSSIRDTRPPDLATKSRRGAKPYYIDEFARLNVKPHTGHLMMASLRALVKWRDGI
jgi:hypothetical protein